MAKTVEVAEAPRVNADLKESRDLRDQKDHQAKMVEVAVVRKVTQGQQDHLAQRVTLALRVRKELSQFKKALIQVMAAA